MRYPAPNTRMQYTGKSFSKSFGKLLNFILIEKKGYTEIERDETFPETRKYHSFYLDLFEAKIIDPVILLITRFINLFQFIQNGKIQAYVIYGIVFILDYFYRNCFKFLALINIINSHIIIICNCYSVCQYKSQRYNYCFNCNCDCIDKQLLLQ